MNNVLSHEQSALKRYLTSKKVSDLIHAISNQFNFEIMGLSSGYRMLRFLSKKTIDIFSKAVSSPAILATSVTQILAHINEEAIHRIEALKAQYAKRNTPDSSLTKDFTLTNDYVSAEVREQLLAQEHKFEQKLQDDSRTIVPDLTSSVEDAFADHVARRNQTAKDFKLRLDFDEKGKCTYLHCADHVETLKGTDDNGNNRILTFSYASNKAPDNTQDVTRFAPSRQQTSEPVPVYAQA